jgi:hypothetical protein
MTDSAAASADPVMDAILRAVGEGQAGAAGSARGKLLALWSEIGVLGDPLHRCVLAHYLADLYPDPARALAWDVRALDAADAVTEQRAQQLHGNLHIAGFYPSLHLNLADNYRRLGSFDAAAEHIGAAAQHSGTLPGGPYGDSIRTAIEEVAAAITAHDTAPRASAPGAVS